MDTLQRSLLGALEHDQKKTQVNDAKLRAVAQRVEYDDFEKLVAGAHLKPVKPRSAESAATSRPFDCFVMPKYEVEPGKRTSSSVPVTTAGAVSLGVPKNAAEFSRVWRRQCRKPAERLAYLRLLEPSGIPVLFRTEVEPTMLDGIIEALRLCWSELVESNSISSTAEGDVASERGKSKAEEWAWLGSFLLGLSQVNRLSMSLEFASKATTESLLHLVEALQKRGEAEPPLKAEELLLIRTAFNM